METFDKFRKDFVRNFREFLQTDTAGPSPNNSRNPSRPFAQNFREFLQNDARPPNSRTTTSRQIQSNPSTRTNARVSNLRNLSSIHNYLR